MLPILRTRQLIPIIVKYNRIKIVKQKMTKINIKVNQPLN